jgi:hypothetical protein
VSDSEREFQLTARIGLFGSLGILAWGLASYWLFHTSFQVPRFVESLAISSGGLAVLRGVLAIVYIGLGTRTASSIGVGTLLLAANWLYAWQFLSGL